jgi:PPOX class probable F420-dependent enzyme
VAPPSSMPDARSRLAQARVARLATVGPDGTPHLVPCCLAVDERVAVAYSAVDDKPKRSIRLSRLTDLAIHPVVTLLVDEYDEDWNRLWWVRVSGPARELAAPGGRGPGVVPGDGGEHGRAVQLLRAKYPQYRTHRLDGPVLAISLERWRSWAASPRPFRGASS